MRIAGHCAGDYYNTGGCYVGLAPLSKKADAWEPFNATFAPAEIVVTVYVNQEGRDYSSVVYDLTVQQLIGTPVLFVRPPFCFPRPLPSPRPIHSLVSWVPSMYRVPSRAPKGLAVPSLRSVYRPSRAPSR